MALRPGGATMTPIRPLLALALVALVALPAADAQQNMSLTLTVTPPKDHFGAGASATVPAQVTLYADATVVTELNGVPVTYSVVRAPAWARVTISPSNDVFWFGGPQPSPTYAATKSFTITVSTLPNATGSDVDSIEIVAVAQPQGPLAHGAASHA